MYRRVHPILDGLRRRGTTVYLVSCRTRVLASRSKQSARIAGSANAQGAIESLPMRHLVNIFHPDCDRTVRKWIGQGEHSSISAANEGERLLDRGSANFGKTHSGLQEVSGHDFSRAVNAIKPARASAPEGRPLLHRELLRDSLEGYCSIGACSATDRRNPSTISEKDDDNEGGAHAAHAPPR